MKKKVLVIAAIAFAVVLLVSVVFFVLPIFSNQRYIDGNLKLEKGVLTWDAIPNTAGYEVDLGSGGIPVSENQYNLAANCGYSGEVSIMVRAVRRNNSRTDIGSMKVVVNKLAQPVISIEGEGEETCFVWSAVENATGYTYDAHDGNGTVSAVADGDGRYRVAVSNMDEQMIRVTAVGGSDNGVVYASNDCLYRYSSSRVFDLSLIAEHPAVYYATGSLGAQEVIKVGTDLPKGTYPMTVSFYTSTVSGEKLKGNGTWGRRIVDEGKPKTHRWLCEEAPSAEWPEAAGTIPYPDEVVTVDLLVQVDISSNALIFCYDFEQGDMVVVKDLVYEGKSVLNDRKGEPNPELVIDPFDLSKVDNYLAYYRGLGKWMAKDKSDYSDFVLRVPTKLADGFYCVSIQYYLCGPEGQMLTGNGMWGRRVSTEGTKTEDMLWIIENDVDSYKATDIPFPTHKKSHIFEVEVKNGYIWLECYDFNENEYFIVESVTLAPPVEGGFDLTTLDQYPASYRGTGQWLARDKSNLADFVLRVPAELADGEHTVKVNYYVCGSRGEKLTGNGLWGRRVLYDGAKDTDMLWLNEDKVGDYPAVELPEANQVSSVTFDVVVKDGYFELLCYDFDKGDYFIVESVTLAPAVEGGFDLTTLDQYPAGYRGTGQWLARDKSNKADFILRVPTELANGEHTVKVNYYVCGSRGEKLTGNGLWGRRVLRDGAKDADTLWLNENKVEDYPAVKLPEPNELGSFTFEVEVKDGYFELMCLDFDKGDYFIVESVEEEEIAGEVFDLTTLGQYPAGYRGTGQWLARDKSNKADFILRVPTELANGEHTVKVNYYVCGSRGEKLTGNGLWGRRVLRDGAKDADMLWLNESKVGDYPAVKLPEPNELGSFTFKVEVKDGYFELMCLDFDQGDYFIVESAEPVAGAMQVEDLRFVDTSDGFVFEAQSTADLKTLHEAGTALQMTVKYQFSEISAENAAAAQPEDRNVPVTVDANGRICLHPELEQTAVKLVIPAGTVITALEDSNTRIVIAKEVILERDAAFWGTKDGWAHSAYTDVTLTFRNVANGYVFSAESAANLADTYGAWKKLNLTVQVLYAASASELENAKLTEKQAFFNIDEQGKFLLYSANEYTATKLVIPAGTVITPGEQALSQNKLRITNEIVLVRDSANWGTSDGWQQITCHDVTLRLADSADGFVFDGETTADIKALYEAGAEFTASVKLDSVDTTVSVTVDANGRICLHPEQEQTAVQLVIPAGTVITPVDLSSCNVHLELTEEVVLERDASYVGTKDGWEQIFLADVMLNFQDASNGYIFDVTFVDAEKEFDLADAYGVWANNRLQITVQSRYGANASAAENGALEEVSGFFNVDESGKIHLYSAKEYAGIQLVIPAGAIVTPTNPDKSNVRLRIAEEIVLKRASSYLGTFEGWQVSTQQPDDESYVDVTLSYKDASNGLVFNVECAEDLKQVYGAWKNMDVTVSRQFSRTSAQEALAAQLEEINAVFCVDDSGHLCLYNTGDVGCVKIVIPAGTVITPTDKALSDVPLRITNEIVLQRGASYWQTSEGWQVVTQQEPEEEVYTDVTLRYKNASNGLVFNVECAEDLKRKYGAWKNLDVKVSRQFSRASVQEALAAQLEEINAVFCVDDSGHLCLYSTGDVGCVKIVIPAGTVITPTDKALSDVPLRITNEIVLERQSGYWMTSDGWIQQETE